MLEPDVDVYFINSCIMWLLQQIDVTFQLVMLFYSDLYIVC